MIRCFQPMELPSPMRTIGDILGNRSSEGTAAYMRLARDDLLEVGLPVPHKKANDEGQELLSLLVGNQHYSTVLALLRCSLQRDMILENSGFSANVGILCHC
jgi:hypothetical protein